MSLAGKSAPRRAARWIAAGLFLGALLYMNRRLDLAGLLEAAARRAAASGARGAAAFMLLYIVACVLMIPGSALTLAAGAVYGLGRGTALALLSATAGATAAFVIGRHAARDWVEARISKDPRFAALDSAVGREGFKIVLLTRLSPAFPFNLLNYAFGLTKVRLKDYVLGSGLGMIPGTLLYAYLGAVAGQAIAGKEAAGPAVWALRLLGLAATIAVTVAAAQLARQALRAGPEPSLTERPP